MGSSSASFSSEVVKAVVFVSLVWFSSSSLLYGCKGCIEEERIALLQLKDSYLNNSNGYSPVTEWVGDDCCKWPFVSCGLFHSKYRVISIDLEAQRNTGVEKWYPNASLFTHLRELQTLDLKRNNIGGWIMPEALCELRNLKVLDLYWNSLDDEGLPRCLALGLLSLEEIYLGGQSINLSSPLLSALCGFRNLRVLDLSDNVLSNIGSFPPCMLATFSSLEALYLRNFTDLEQSPNALIALQGARNVQVLDLSSNNLSDTSLRALCGFRNLRVLDLSDNVLSNIGSFPPCKLDTFSSLEALYLRNFTDLEESPNALIALQGARNLQHLYLSSNNLSDTSLRALCGKRNLMTLDLSYSNLIVEHVPPCLQENHPYLESLDLGGTFTQGSSSYDLLKGLTCGSEKLKSLSLGWNNLSDESLPSCLLHNNSILEDLHLSYNNLKGSLGFSTGLCRLRKLRYLDLTMNSIAGNFIWTCLSQSNSLEELYLGQNQISGTIPPLISNLTSLVELDLSSNKLGGVFFFSEFANLSKLESIDLSDNRELEVETEFPTHWVPSFQLTFLLLENCKLNKRTHGNIPGFISTQYKLSYLDLSDNSLQGTIPSWLFYNATQYYFLSLRGNHLDGAFPLPPPKNETSMLEYLDISDNDIKGQLPTNIDVLFPNLKFLNMSENKLEGCIPPSFGNLFSLDLSNNHFHGQVPHRLTQNSTYLVLLILSNNYLHAMPRVSNMTCLQVLSLDGNLFTTPFPITPSSVPSIKILDISRNSISGYIQDWLPVFPNLLSLLMRGNHFVGCLPAASLCQMQQLRFLDISNNHLSGSISSCLNNITSWLQESQVYLSQGIFVTGYQSQIKINFVTKGNLYSYEGLPLDLMTGIDLSLNQLSSNIPSQMGELRALVSLNLSHNSLMGYIPQSFKELEKLESLDVSHNKLVGSIPPQMIQLCFLSTFTVAFNQLSGKIPYEKNFATFNKDSYIGNPGLCGPPTEVNCSSPHHYESEEGDEQSLLDNDLFFYSLVAISYMLGFWVVVALLLLSRNWRRKYYAVMDPYIDWCSEKLFWFFSSFKNCW